MAELLEEDLEKVKKDIIKRIPEIDPSYLLHDIDFTIFQQVWGSTALGFSGIGGQALTTAYTFVVYYRNIYYVYFGSRFAYEVDLPNEHFELDLADRQLKSVKEAQNLYKALRIV